MLIVALTWRMIEEELSEGGECRWNITVDSKTDMFNS